MSIGFGCLAIIKMVDLTDPTNIFYSRVAFGVGISLTASFLGIIYNRIQTKAEKGILMVSEADLKPQPALAGLLGQPAPDTKPDEMTVEEYDMTKLKASASALSSTLFITLLLHLWKGFMPPLIFQAVMQPFSLYSSELFRIHILGQTGTSHKELKRPWKGNQSGLAAQWKQLKKDMEQEMGRDVKPSRKNKKDENARKSRGK